MTTALKKELADSGITDVVGVVCFSKGWHAALKASSETALQLADSIQEYAVGQMISDGINSLKQK